MDAHLDADSTSRRFLIIAGVNKAGTTSLFVSLAAHPEIAAAAVKETRYFLPVRYGQPLEPRSVWDGYFRDAPPNAIRLEATPSYFYGGAPLARAVDDALPGTKILVVLREPVERAISFFKFQRARLRIPEATTLTDYLAEADKLTDTDFRDPANEPWFAIRGGCYADFLPDWLEVFGTGRLRIVYFDELVAEPARTLAEVGEWLGLDSSTPLVALSSENRTTGYKNPAMQRFALTMNDRLEKFLRRHYRLKRTLRSAYYRVNGRAMNDEIPDGAREEVARRFEEPNRRLVEQLSDAGIALPAWLPVRDTPPPA